MSDEQTIRLTCFYAGVALGTIRGIAAEMTGDSRASRLWVFAKTIEEQMHENISALPESSGG